VNGNAFCLISLFMTVLFLMGALKPSNVVEMVKEMNEFSEN
jgi:hypothetical protein